MDKSQIDQPLNTINDWGWTVNARIRFNNFIKAVSTNENLPEEIQKIYSLIDEIVLDEENDQFIRRLDVGEKYYRARIIDVIDHGDVDKGLVITPDGMLKGYNEFNSREPMLRIGGDGRNNIAGMPYLYVATDEGTACVEVKPHLGDLISLACFEVNKPLHVIDFASDKIFQRNSTELHGMSMGVFFTCLLSAFSEPVRDGKEYHVTQYISDYLRKTGIDGIKYRSFLSPGGFNVTLFNSHPSNIKFCGSKIVIYQQAIESFWDFSNEQAIIVNKSGKYIEYDDKIALDLKKKIKESFAEKKLS